MIKKARKSEKITAIFGEWEETILWSCLSGMMGAVYVPEGEKVRSAMAVLGDFCFLAGEPNRELALGSPVWGKKDYMILIPQNESWEEIIAACHQSRMKKITRYATKKDTVFDKQKLQEAVCLLPDGCELKKMDEELFRICLGEVWCKDLVSQFSDYRAYERMGMGFAIVHGAEVVCGASSYSSYPGGIEVEIDTRKDWRRKNLAYICGAKLILGCLERGLYPSWDAHSRASLALAEKLGYQFSHSYCAYEVYGEAMDCRRE